MDLPFEILVYIFKYLPKSDRKAASETCKSWYAAANDFCFLKNKVIMLYKTVLTDELSPLLIYDNSINIYSNYFFNEVEIPNKLNNFWDESGCNLKDLTLRNCDVCEKVFAHILLKCTNLEGLRVQSCNDLFMSGQLLEGRTKGLLTNNLNDLLLLDLSGNRYLTDALFNRFVQSAPALKELNLSGCSLQFHMGLVKKFYGSETDITSPSESVLTFHFVWKFIVSRAASIKRLLFSKTNLDGVSLAQLSEVEDLNLEYLELHCCDQLTNFGIKSLALNQSYLKVLDLGLCARVTDQSLVYICNNLVNLEELNIQRCRAVTDLGITEIHKLKKLRSLNISECELISIEGLEKGICAEVNNILQILDVHSLNLDQAGLILLSERLPKLLYLDVSYCFNAVTDTSIQVVFKNQVLLQTLKLSHCDKVSDAGLTGLRKIYSGANETPASVSSSDDSIVYPKIHLGSKAEEEIVLDARRKRDVMLMCEKLSFDSTTGYSLSRLRGLQELDISSCNKITDVSLIYAFNFIEMISLNLSRCQQITHEGMECLVQNCRSIENLNLTDCYNLKDEAVQVTVKGLKRLQQLELKGCNQLSDETLNAIIKHCEKLKFLDVQGCRKITPELACSMNLPSLHTVLMSKPGPYITEGVKNRKPATAFLPALMRKLRLH